MSDITSNLIEIKLRNIKHIKKISGKQLAKKSGLSATLVSALLRGDYPNSLKKPIIIKLAFGLGVGLTDLTSVKSDLVIKKINHLLKINDKNVRDLAEYLHCSPSTIYRWNHGTRAIPISTLVKVAKCLGVPVNYVLGRSLSYNRKNIEHPIISKKVTSIDIGVAYRDGCKVNYNGKPFGPDEFKKFLRFNKKVGEDSPGFNQGRNRPITLRSSDNY